MDSSGSCPVPQLESDEALLEGLGRLGPRRSLGRQSESCAALERNVHYRGITVEIDIHIRYYSIIHVQYVYTYKLYIWIAN